jgi:hypothetical protein
MPAPALNCFFFHVVGKDQVHRDDPGEVFSSAQTAHNHATRIAYELRHDANQGSSVCVTDASGTELARVLIGGPKL